MVSASFSSEFSYCSYFYVIFKYFEWSSILEETWFNFWSLMELKHMREFKGLAKTKEFVSESGIYGFTWSCSYFTTFLDHFRHHLKTSKSLHNHLKIYMIVWLYRRFTKLKTKKPIFLLDTARQDCIFREYVHVCLSKIYEPQKSIFCCSKKLQDCACGLKI